MGDPAPSDDEINAHIGRRVKSARKRLKLTQAALADAIGVTYQQVQKYERGATRLGAHQLFHIACLLEITVGSLFEGLPHPNRDDARQVRWTDLDTESLALAHKIAAANPAIRHAINGLVDNLASLDAVRDADRP